MERRVLLDIQIQDDQAVKNVTSLKNAIGLLKDENKLLQKDYEKGTITYREYTNAVVKNDALIRANQKSLRELNTQIDNNIKAATSATGSYDQLAAQHANLTKELRGMGAEQRLNTEAGQEMEKQAKEIFEEMKRLQSVTGSTSLNVGNYSEAIIGATNSITGMEARLKELQEIIKTSDVGSKQFKKASDEAGNLKLSIDQALGKVNEFGEREPKNPVKKAFEDGFAAAGALASSVQLLNVAMGENESVAKMQAKALQGIAVAQNLSNILKEKGAIIDTFLLIKTKALAVAQRLYMLAVGQTTGAMKLLRLAIVSTGIGALVVGVGMLVANFKDVNFYIDKFRSKLQNFLSDLLGSSEAAKVVAFSLELMLSPLTLIITGFNELGKVLGVIKVQKVATDLDTLNKVMEKNESNFEKANRHITNNIALLKAKGANEKEVSNLEKQLLEDRVNQWAQYEKHVTAHIKNIKKSGRSLTDDEQKALDDFNKKVSDARLALAVKEAESEKERKQRAMQSAKEKESALAETRKIELDLDKALIKGKIEIREQGTEREIALIKFETETQIKALSEQLEALEKNNTATDATRELFEERRKQLVKKAESDIAKIKSDANLARTEKEQQEYNASYIGQVEALIKRTNLEKQYASLTITDKKEYNKKLLEIDLAFYQEQLRLAIENMGTLADTEKVMAQQRIDELSNIIANLQESLKEKLPPTFADMIGLDAEGMDVAKSRLAEIGAAFQSLTEIINAAYQVQLNEVTAKYDAEEEAINRLKISEEAKEKKLKEVRKRRAMDEYKIQKEQHEMNVAMGIVNATINGAQALIANFAVPDPTLGIMSAIRAALITATTIAQIAVIASQPPPKKPSFYEGGFTEMSGNPRMKSSKSNANRDVHHNEYITPWKVLRKKEAWPHIAALENMRTSIPGRLNMVGFADGGFADIEKVNIQSESIVNMIMAAMSSVNIITRVTDINNEQNRAIVNRVRSEI